jgi:hypothetical protein
MPLLLVDDRDGRIVAELESEDEAVRVLEAMAGKDSRVAEYPVAAGMPLRARRPPRNGREHQDPDAS